MRQEALRHARSSRPVAQSGCHDLAIEHGLARLALRPALVGQRQIDVRSPRSVDEQHRIGHGPVDQLDEPARLGRGSEGQAQHGDLQVLAHLVPILRDADRGGLERRDPRQLARCLR